MFSLEHMRPPSCRWAISGGLQVAVADAHSCCRQRHCPPNQTPHYAQQQSGGEPEGPRNCWALLQGGSRKAFHRSAWDRTWQLWGCIFCEYFTQWGFGVSPDISTYATTWKLLRWHMETLRKSQRWAWWYSVFLLLSTVFTPGRSVLS